MAPHPVDSRLKPGRRIEAFTVETLVHGTLRVPDTGLVHLQFRRYAGCPICNYHLRAFRGRHGELLAGGVKVVAFFSSPAEEMRPFQGDLPFASVPDPERVWFARFGVIERSKLAALHPSAVAAASKGIALGKWKPGLNPNYDSLPADFLVAPDGELVDAKYGAHANDHWEVDDVLALARQYQRRKR
ncbi:MAG: AhpC/TSA family protein [Myxococcota bacterium]|jgi:peroxiredoxin